MFVDSDPLWDFLLIQRPSTMLYFNGCYRCLAQIAFVAFRNEAVRHRARTFDIFLESVRLHPNNSISQDPTGTEENHDD